MSQAPQRPQRPGSSSGGIGKDMGKGMTEASKGHSAAFGFVGVLFLFWFIGRWIDGALGIEPWAQVIGAVVGWVLGTVTAIYMAQAETKKD